VLPCGHCFCVVCLEELKRHALSKTHLLCPNCRESVAVAEISQVNNKMQQEKIKNEADTINSEFKDLENLKEHKSRKHSAKVEAIIAEIMKIVQCDPTDKIIIFSTVCMPILLFNFD